MNDALKKYFKNEKITKAVLETFQVPIHEESEGSHIITYTYQDGTIKKYNTSDPSKSTTDFIGDVDNRFEVFGIKQLPKSGEKVFITSREQDVLTLYAEGYSAICFSLNNPQAERSLRILKNRFNEVIAVFTYNPSYKHLLPNCSKHDIPHVYLPSSRNEEGFTEYLENCKSTLAFEALVSKAISKFYGQKSYYPASDLGKIISEKEDFIIPEILPKGILAGLVGGSDSGKSLLALQFAISYSLGKKFLGHQIIGNKKVLYCAFEDDHNSIKRRLDKLTSKLTSQERSHALKNIFITHDNSSYENIIEKHMEIHPDTGILILDTLSELMTDKDMNSTSGVRSAMRPIHNSLKKHELTAIFLHHLTKSSEMAGSLNKNGVLGSQGIEAKARVIFGLKKGNQAIRTLSIIKGNEIPEEFKAKSYQQYLKLNNENLWFEKSEYLKNSSIKKETQEYDWAELFGNNRLFRSGVINNLLQKKYGISQKLAEKVIHKELFNFRDSKVGWYKNPALKS